MSFLHFQKQLRSVKNEDKKLEYYRIISDESHRLNKQVDNILDFIDDVTAGLTGALRFVSKIHVHLFTY